MENIFSKTIVSPIGFIEINSDKTSIISVSFVKNENNPTSVQPEILCKATRQLSEYFEGTRKEFDLDLNPSGTGFQKKVWREVEKIPFGKTAAYLEIAIQTGSSKNTRAVGLANGKNPIPIIIPCHRVVGTNGKLTGYSGGLDKKKWLILHEQKYTGSKGLLF